MSRRLLPALLAFTPAIAVAQRPPDDQADLVISAADPKAVVDGVIDAVTKSYVFPKLATQVAAKLKATRYDQLTSAKAFANAVTDDLATVAHDKHLRVIYSHEPLPVRAADARPTDAEKQRFAELARYTNAGFCSDARLTLRG